MKLPSKFLSNKTTWLQNKQSSHQMISKWSLGAVMISTFAKIKHSHPTNFAKDLIRSTRLWKINKMVNSRQVFHNHRRHQILERQVPYNKRKNLLQLQIAKILKQRRKYNKQKTKTRKILKNAAVKFFD